MGYIYIGGVEEDWKKRERKEEVVSVDKKYGFRGKSEEISGYQDAIRWCTIRRYCCMLKKS